MSLNKKISQAKAKLLVEYPFFGTIASRLKLIPNDDIQAFKSDGISLEYNDDYLNSLTINEMEFVFANGAMHASLAHEYRKNNRSGWLWQLATDYAVNDMLVENGLHRPDYAHYSKRFSGLYAEEIYEELKADILRDELEYESDDEEDIQNQDAENTQEEQLFDEFVKATLDAEEAKEALASGLYRFFKLGLKSKIDWRDELRVAIDRFYKDDYAQMPPNKKFLHLGFYLPSSISQRFKLVIAVDSSGSVDENLLNEFLNELNFLMNTIPSYEINLLVCDDKINSHQVFYSGDRLEVDLKGGGATDFRPVFEFVQDNLQDIQLLLYFSDLEGIFPKEEPSYEVKWISPNEKEVPFGEIIVLKD